MADRPILFSAPMVRALLDGTKTQTRRVLSQQNMRLWTGGLDYAGRYAQLTADEFSDMMRTACDFRVIDGNHLLWQARHQFTDEMAPAQGIITFAPGDRLWVREAYYQRGHWEPVTEKRTKGGKQKWAFIPTGPVSFEEPAEYRKGRHHNDPGTVAWHKRLGRFMPRTASRLTLTVTDVRVERLQDISERDCIAEGLERGNHGGFCPTFRGAPELDWRIYPDAAYRALWNHINGPGAWEANPWVVAVSFEVGRQNIDAKGNS